ncbi:MAG TPA: uroporphyrinogen-III synthase [Bacteroidales bacterium]|jgi:uroporphyrinogen-III synthase|nr:uroporphyrinogen-III synthase [Bacteroidales bacterium]HOB27108.1 uroporphyrinogen-III synthase [Bacteroidales bacterium]HOL74981.1 uroporphyrinogen-III synthase [Bacteroidales bacterium]HPU46997.1 uroporphyrinogen-III synthase [Bacteroidales bacterium]HPZ36200.1 uroporphyrinogen-III synthase [Bacteroidales bacterium]
MSSMDDKYKILISQNKPNDYEKSPYHALELKYNIEFSFIKLFNVECIDIKDYRNQKIDINKYFGIIFTSKIALDYFFSLLEQSRTTISNEMRYFCLTEQIALYLQKYMRYKKRKFFFGTGTPASVIDNLKQFSNEKFILVSSSDGNESFANALRQHNINFDNLFVCKNVPINISDINIKDYKMIAFFSPHGIKSLFHNFPNYEQGDQVIAVCGEYTKKMAEEHNLKISVYSPTEKFPSLVHALDDFFAKQNNKQLKNIKNEEKTETNNTKVSNTKKAKPANTKNDKTKKSPKKTSKSAEPTIATSTKKTSNTKASTTRTKKLD